MGSKPKKDKKFCKICGKQLDSRSKSDYCSPHYNIIGQRKYPRECAEYRCERKSRKRGLCEKHYSQLHLKSCSIDGCNKKYSANGYCAMHNTRFKKYGDPHITKAKHCTTRPKICSFGGCDKKHRMMGFCQYHYDINKPEYQFRHKHEAWSRLVKDNDNRECVQCGSKDGVNAHHIFYKKPNPKLRFNLNNGITLCHNCHWELHKLNPVRIIK